MLTINKYLIKINARFAHCAKMSYFIRAKVRAFRKNEALNEFCSVIEWEMSSSESPFCRQRGY